MRDDAERRHEVEIATRVARNFTSLTLRVTMDAANFNREQYGTYDMNGARIRIWLAILSLAAASILAQSAVANEGQPDAPAPAPVDIAALAKLRSGLPAYPPPMMAVARTPYVIGPLPGRAVDIQTDFGYPGGFSGFVDASTGAIGYPGYRNFTNLDVAYDAEKLCLLVCMPYPFGRKLRANAAEPSAGLEADDVFEAIIDPRDRQGRSRGPLYRIIGNAGGVCRLDRDFPQIGQSHQPWQAGVKYGSMMWDPMGSWMGAVQVPFADLGGPPGHHVPMVGGDSWGIQMALRYADPKITAVLSPSDDFLDRGRFARLRFDDGRRANYRCHWLAEDEIKKGTFCIGGIFSNGANQAVPLAGHVTLYQGGREIGGGGFAHAARALSKYDGDMPPCRFRSRPATAAERDTVARLVVVDQQAQAVIYDQFLPYWTPARASATGSSSISPRSSPSTPAPIRRAASSTMRSIARP